MQHEKMLDALSFRSETAAPVEPVHHAIKRLMRPAQVRRHEVRIVEVGQCCARMGRAGIQHGLASGSSLDSFAPSGGIGKVLQTRPME